MTISLFPRIFATLPSTAMRLAPSNNPDGLARLYLSWRGPPQDGRISAMPNRTNRIGRHLPTSGGLAKTLWAARELGCETIQIFVSNPQAWADPRRRQDADTFVEGSLELGISPVVAHAKYLINLASASEEQRELSGGGPGPRVGRRRRAGDRPGRRARWQSRGRRRGEGHGAARGRPGACQGAGRRPRRRRSSFGRTCDRELRRGRYAALLEVRGSRGGRAARRGEGLRGHGPRFRSRLRPVVGKRRAGGRTGARGRCGRRGRARSLQRREERTRQPPRRA